MNKEPKILIGTLYAGENEIDECTRSVKDQTYEKWKHKIFKGLGKQEAQTTLYRFFMSRAAEFDLFIKMDADMVFAQNDILERIISLFKKERELDHLVIAVEDYISATNIMGMHVFSSRCSWGDSRDSLFTDYNPKFNGKKLKIENPENLKIKHSPNPSEFQAFRFGVHRAQKAFQFGRLKIKKEQMDFQWKFLNNIWKNYKEKRDKRMGLALMGAEMIINKEINGKLIIMIHPRISKKNFNLIKNKGESKIFYYLKPKWDTPLYKNIRRKTKIIKPRLIFALASTKKYLKKTFKIIIF